MANTNGNTGSEEENREKREAKEREASIDADNVTVRTPSEVEKRQEKADKTAQDDMKQRSQAGHGGKTYKDERVVPSDTNAPDAGLAPDGTRIAS